MPGMASGAEPGGGESWFALKKDEFYVILDSVLTEMTKCEERNSVSGCIELIKLLSDNETNSTGCGQIPTNSTGCSQIHKRGDESRETEIANRLDPNKSGCNSSGCKGRSDANVKLSNCNKTSVNCRTSTGRRSGDNSHLGIRNDVEYRRHLNKGNHLPSATCVTRRPGYRDKAASRLSRPGAVFSKDGRNTGLAGGKTRDARATLFHPNRIGANHGRPHDIYFSSKRSSDPINGFNAKLSTVSASRQQRQIARNHEMRLQIKSKILCSGPNRNPDTECHPHQSSHTRQAHPGVCAKTKAHNFNGNITAGISPNSASEDQRSCSETNRVDDRHIADTQLDPPLELNSTDSLRVLSTTTPRRAPKSKWTPVDKTVINNILDDILSGDDTHSPLQTVLQQSRNNNDVDTHNDDVTKSADELIVLQDDVKVEDQSDVTSGNNGVIANVKLVDVRRFDVSQMSFKSIKWKSQLLWRMRHDKVSQTSLSSLCLT